MRRRAICVFRVREQHTSTGVLRAHAPNILRVPSPSHDLELNSAHTVLFCTSHLPYELQFPQRR